MKMPCPICTEKWKSGKIDLECGHPHCIDCLLKIADLKCSLCRAIISLTEEMEDKIYDRIKDLEKEENIIEKVLRTSRAKKIKRRHAKKKNKNDEIQKLETKLKALKNGPDFIPYCSEEESEY